MPAVNLSDSIFLQPCSYATYNDVYRLLSNSRTLPHMARHGEATEAQREAFSHALRPHLEGDRGAASRLAGLLGVDRNTLYYWRDGKREPQRRQVFALERELGLPPGGLSHTLGYLPVSARPAPIVSATATDTAAAIVADPTLSDESKRFLLGMYEREQQRSR